MGVTTRCAVVAINVVGAHSIGTNAVTLVVAIAACLFTGVVAVGTRTASVEDGFTAFTKRQVNSNAGIFVASTGAGDITAGAARRALILAGRPKSAWALIARVATRFVAVVKCTVIAAKERAITIGRAAFRRLVEVALIVAAAIRFITIKRATCALANVASLVTAGCGGPCVLGRG